MQNGLCVVKPRCCFRIQNYVRYCSTDWIMLFIQRLIVLDARGVKGYHTNTPF